MVEIKLNSATWTFEEHGKIVQKGGFGEVFRGSGQNGGDVAVKRLHLTAGQAAHRELQIGEFIAANNWEHIVPVLDFGQDAESDRYFIIMPLCDESLQDFIERTGPLDWSDAKPIILNIVAGLREADQIVHRDLKPANVLFHNGKWKIADFGIAKFVEDSTSLETLRRSLTPLYAAPEQWKGERPTSATDVYALGCMLYALLTGRPPFSGDADKVREGHLSGHPPDLDAPSRIKGFVATMLRKSGDSRPSLKRCAEVFDLTSGGAISPLKEGLAAAGARVAQQQAAKETRQQEKERRKMARIDQAKEAGRELIQFRKILFKEIVGLADAAISSDISVVLGAGKLLLGPPTVNEIEVPSSAWDVLAYSEIHVSTAGEGNESFRSAPYGITANLVFAKREGVSDFRWYEVSFWEPFAQGNRDEPFSINPEAPEFQHAVRRSTSRYQIAHGPIAIDGENAEDFKARWMRLFLKAVEGRLARPSRMPLQDSFFE